MRKATTTDDLTLGIGCIVAVALAFGLGYMIGQTTGNRYLEGLVTVVAAPAYVLLLSKNSRLPVRPDEIRALRRQPALQLGLGAIFIASLSLQLTERLTDASLLVARNVIIAAYFTTIPMFFVNAYFIRQRYVRARAMETNGDA